MEQSQLNWITNFIWGIADDVLRDIYVRGKYRDVILPMTVIRRLDAVLDGPAKKAVLDMKAKLDAAGIANQDGALRQAAGQSFYNASPFTLRDLRSRAKAQQLKADFETYLDGFSPNVAEILDKFKFRNQVPTLVENDILGSLIEKFTDSTINLSPEPVRHPDGSIRLPGLDNHAMGTIFEELIRRFNEENNEEAGEHFTPRDVVKLMANLIFLPIADKIESTTYAVYDGACGTGGMLTVAEETLKRLAAEYGKEVSIHLFGQESQPETYAISKADLLLKGEGEEAENFQHGSTLSQDAFRSRQFDFMLSNPPYGKSWKIDLERMGGKSGIKDSRFIIDHAGDPEYSMVTGSDDGQLLFLVNMVSKMKQDTALGSRIAEVHNGSSLFTGGAGSGESNVRRWIIENDWLEAIIALPLNMFYNTGIATYIWVLSNRKPESRQGKVQLIDATSWFRPLRKNLGKKNCELAEEDIQRIATALVEFQESEHSKIFPREEFGYWKIRVRRPLRLRVDLSSEVLERFRAASAAAKEGALAEIVDGVAAKLGPGPHLDYNVFLGQVAAAAADAGIKLTAKRTALLQAILTMPDDSAEPVIRKETKARKDVDAEREALYGRYLRAKDGRSVMVEFEPDPAFKDSEQIPLLEDGGIEAFFRREVLPHLPDAWIDEDATRIGYEIVFARYFYKPEQTRSLDEIKAELYALEDESEGLLARIVGAR